MRWRLAFLPLIAACPAGVQAAPPPDGRGPEEAIIVEGTRISPKEERRAAVDYTRSLGVARGEISVARWSRPVCPGVKGLTGAPAARVMDRLRAIATEAQVPLAPDGCRANLIVAFVEDGADMVQRLVGKEPRLVSQVSGPDRRALKSGDAPIRWWYSVTFGTGTGAGVPASNIPSPATSGNAEGGGSVLPDSVPSSGTHSASLIRTQAVRFIDMATVVVDVNRAEGVTLDAVAAYAAMVGLAEISRTATPEAPSILNLFAATPRGEEAGTMLSTWDRSLLHTLYAMAPDRSGHAQRRRIVNALVDTRTDASR